MTDGCQLCTTVAEGGPHGGWLTATDQWGVMGHPLQVPGWLSMVALRHCESPADMTAAEAAEYGPMARYVARGLMAATGADRVYSYSLGHTVRHLHLLVGVPGAAEDTQGPRLLTRILQRDPTVADPDAAERRLAAVRDWFGSNPLQPERASG